MSSMRAPHQGIRGISHTRAELLFLGPVCAQISGTYAQDSADLSHSLNVSDRQASLLKLGMPSRACSATAAMVAPSMVSFWH